ncbi:MAG: hypothetical protein HON51_03655 [Gammaproteobacteria bacterium]|jgi:hypothetical protein|nr:hypothetical protein [Gammaproteobacteria bacterium]MBT6575327.1 hypothetical protein [Gammaproteobacteria bacterium]MBT7435280.1 hypothetical protein [Gammaproteobacteria bacterium]
MEKEYDSSCIKILDYAPDIWSQAIALDEQYNYGVKLIERGLIACAVSGVSSDYFIDRYLKKLPVEINQAVSDVYAQGLKDDRH